MSDENVVSARAEALQRMETCSHCNGRGKTEHNCCHKFMEQQGAKPRSSGKHICCQCSGLGRKRH